MPVSSSSGLDIDLVFSNAAACSSSSPSSGPWIPPRSQWPLPGEDDAAAGEGDDDDHGQDDWGPPTSASKSRWLTAMTSWSSRREGSGSSAARMAIATADGSVHFFTQEHQRRASSPSKSPNRDRARSPSPAPSIASTRSGFHPRADSHAPPFAGFSSHESTAQEHILSPTSPTSTNLASTAAWKPSSPEGSRQQGFDALESRLESQYHSGSAAMSAGSSATHSHHRDSSVVGSFMESLGLSKSTGHHHHSHHTSPSRSRRDSASASASAEMSRSSSSRTTTGATPTSSHQLTPPPAASPSSSSSRRHSHARSSAIIGPSSAMASLHAPSSGGGGGGEEMKRSRSVSQATASSSRRREDEVNSPSQAHPPTEPAVLESVKPYARLAPNGRDASPIVAMVTCCLSHDSSRAPSSVAQQPDTLLLLHRSGWMTAVSLHDGTVLGDIDLASASTSTSAEQLSTTTTAAAGSPVASSSGGNSSGGGGLVATTLAALRSHSNSPAPIPLAGPAHARLQHQPQLQQQQQPTSRPGSASLLKRALTSESGPTPPAASASGSQAARPPQQGKHSARSFTSTLQVVQAAEAAPVAVCFDAAQKLLIFVALQAAPGHSASLRVIEAVHLPEAGRDRAPYIVATGEGKGCCAAYLDEERQAVVLQQYKAQSGNAIVKVGSSKLALPDSLAGSAQSCALLDAKKMLVRTTDESVMLLKATAGGEGERLEVVKSLRVARLEEVEVVAGTARGAGKYALARTKASTRLLRIDGDDLTLLEHDAGVDVATSLLCGSSSTLLTASASEAGLQITSVNSTAPTAHSRQLYSSFASTPAIQGLLPLSMERILVLTSSGHLVMTTLNDLVTGAGQALGKATPDSPPCTSAAAPNARLTMFRLIANPTNSSTTSSRPTSSSSSTHKYILTTFSSGSLAFWDPSTLRLVAEWSLFTTSPLSLALFGNNDNTLRLHNCLALSSVDGSLALIALDGLKLLYLIPGRGREAPLVRLAVRADELMLLYADGRARVWDVASMELRRSVSSEQAGGMLVDGRGSWSIFEMSGQDGGSGAVATQTQTGVLSAVQPSTAGIGVGIMRANVKRAVDAAYKAATNGSTATAAAAAVKDGASTFPLPRPKAVRPSASSATIGSTSSASGGAARVQTILRPLMTGLWPWGIDEEMDGVVKGLFDPPLQVSKSSTVPAVVGTGLGSASMGEGGERRHYHALAGKEADSLGVSGVINATRFLALVSMLDVLAVARKGRTEKAKDNSGATSIARLTTWLSTTLPSSVAGFAPLNPAVLALHLVEPTPSIRSAATLLLERRIEGMDPQEVEGLVDGPGSWRALLPTGSAAGQRRQTQAQSLSLVGFLCLKRYSALEPSLLRDVAESVSFSLSPTLSPDHPGQQQQQQLRLIALHLCVQGFAIWQNYVDAMALLRALFALAVYNGEQEAGEVQSAARQAVVQVAEEHAPLFMTTLNLDLLAAGAAGTDGGSNVATSSPSGAQQAMRTMRLLTFLVGQRPNLLVASLPRIAEAVVKALDPTISASPHATTAAGSNSNASATSSPKSTTSLLPQPPGTTSTTQRDLLLPTATSLISSLVRTYHTLAFHGPTQRLAVGTHEGAIVMYELRSATRLFVLEGGHGHGHQAHGQRGMGPGNVGGGHGGHATTAAGPLTMLSFSPDGRRLISLSLSEGKALAWKVGSSLASWLLRPGGVPRQGGSSSSSLGGGSGGGGTAGAEPAYKVWRFRPFSGEEVGEEVGVDVRCDWVAEKRCEVEIVEEGGKGRRERTMWDVE